MTAFSKKLKKIKKEPKNCLVLGSMFGTMEDSHEIFKSVFVISSSDNLLRKRNIIYREDYDAINLLPDIDFIFIDKEYFPVLDKIMQVWRRHKSYILTEAVEPLSKDLVKFLRSEHYSIAWVDKRFYFWEFKAK